VARFPGFGLPEPWRSPERPLARDSTSQKSQAGQVAAQRISREPAAASR